MLVVCYKRKPWSIFWRNDFLSMQKIISYMKKLVKESMPLSTELSAFYLMNLVAIKVLDLEKCNDDFVWASGFPAAFLQKNSDTTEYFLRWLMQQCGERKVNHLLQVSQHPINKILDLRSVSFVPSISKMLKNKSSNKGGGLAGMTVASVSYCNIPISDRTMLPVGDG